jgi:hypothetical protein
MKPPWFSRMILGRNVLILFAITLVMILYPILQSDIGWNLENLWAAFSLGIKYRKEELVLEKQDRGAIK